MNKPAKKEERLRRWAVLFKTEDAAVREKVARQLSDIFFLPGEEAARLLTKTPVILFDHLSRELAGRIVKFLRSQGADVTLVPDQDAPGDFADSSWPAADVAADKEEQAPARSEDGLEASEAGQNQQEPFMPSVWNSIDHACRLSGVLDGIFKGLTESFESLTESRRRLDDGRKLRDLVIEEISQPDFFTHKEPSEIQNTRKKLAVLEKRCDKLEALYEMRVREFDSAGAGQVLAGEAWQESLKNFQRSAGILRRYARKIFLDDREPQPENQERFLYWKQKADELAGKIIELLRMKGSIEDLLALRERDVEDWKIRFKTLASEWAALDRNHRRVLNESESAENQVRILFDEKTRLDIQVKELTALLAKERLLGHRQETELFKMRKQWNDEVRGKTETIRGLEEQLRVLFEENSRVKRQIQELETAADDRVRSGRDRQRQLEEQYRRERTELEQQVAALNKDLQKYRDQQRDLQVYAGGAEARSREREMILWRERVTALESKVQFVMELKAQLETQLAAAARDQAANEQRHETLRGRLAELEEEYQSLHQKWIRTEQARQSAELSLQIKEQREEDAVILNERLMEYQQEKIQRFGREMAEAKKELSARQTELDQLENVRRELETSYRNERKKRLEAEKNSSGQLAEEYRRLQARLRELEALFQKESKRRRAAEGLIKKIRMNGSRRFGWADVFPFLKRSGLRDSQRLVRYEAAVEELSTELYRKQLEVLNLEEKQLEVQRQQGDLEKELRSRQAALLSADRQYGALKNKYDWAVRELDTAAVRQTTTGEKIQVFEREKESLENTLKQQQHKYEILLRAHHETETSLRKHLDEQILASGRSGEEDNLRIEQLRREIEALVLEKNKTAAELLQAFGESERWKAKHAEVLDRYDALVRKFQDSENLWRVNGGAAPQILEEERKQMRQEMIACLGVQRKLWQQQYEGERKNFVEKIRELESLKERSLAAEEFQKQLQISREELLERRQQVESLGERLAVLEETKSSLGAELTAQLLEIENWKKKYEDAVRDRQDALAAAKQERIRREETETELSELRQNKHDLERRLVENRIQLEDLEAGFRKDRQIFHEGLTDSGKQLEKWKQEMEQLKTRIHALELERVDLIQSLSKTTQDGEILRQRYQEVLADKEKFREQLERTSSGTEPVLIPAFQVRQEEERLKLRITERESQIQELEQELLKARALFIDRITESAAQIEKWKDRANALSGSAGKMKDDVARLEERLSRESLTAQEWHKRYQDLLDKWNDLIEHGSGDPVHAEALREKFTQERVKLEHKLAESGRRCRELETAQEEAHKIFSGEIKQAAERLRHRDDLVGQLNARIRILEETQARILQDLEAEMKESRKWRAKAGELAKTLAAGRSSDPLPDFDPENSFPMSSGETPGPQAE